MKKVLLILLVIVLLVLTGYYYSKNNLDNVSLEGYFSYQNNTKNESLNNLPAIPAIVKNDSKNLSTVKIANWNLQIFGKSKASNPKLMDFYASLIDDYDIVFVQEIRDANSSSFSLLCSLLPDYDCNISSRAGRSTSKEQYGIIYKKGILIKDFKDYNPDSQNRWERSPVEVLFNIKGYELKAYNIHTKPQDVKIELANLESIVSTQGNSLILGDLNADCSYYNPLNNTEFDNWYWAIEDEEDTTSSSTNCAYDRIILNLDTYEEYVSSGTYKVNITSNISDHYLVWVELKIN